MTSHHGQRISFYDMAGIFGTAFLRTSTPDKAINGFRACGLWPFDDTIFQDNEFVTVALTQEGPTIHDTTEQADVAAVANVTHAEVHAVDVPVIELIPVHPAFRVVLLPLHASPFSLKVCAQCEHTLFIRDIHQSMFTLWIFQNLSITRWKPNTRKLKLSICNCPPPI